MHKIFLTKVAAFLFTFVLCGPLLSINFLPLPSVLERYMVSIPTALNRVVCLRQRFWFLSRSTLRMNFTASSHHAFFITSNYSLVSTPVFNFISSPISRSSNHSLLTPIQFFNASFSRCFQPIILIPNWCTISSALAPSVYPTSSGPYD